MKLDKQQLMKRAGLYEGIRESSNADQLTKQLSDAIVKIDSSMSVLDFATAVANVLEEDYGSHNYKQFIYVLNKKLGIQ